LEVTEVIQAYGHKNIQALHKSTFEITKEKWISKRGDCIIAVSADKGFNELSEKFKTLMRNKNALLVITIEVDDFMEVVKAYGNPLLSFTHPTDMVVRKSGYICGRTLAIHADKAACDLSRSLICALKNPRQRVEITLTASI